MSTSENTGDPDDYWEPLKGPDDHEEGWDEDEDESLLEYPDLTESSGLKEYYLRKLDEKIEKYLNKETQQLRRKLAIIFRHKDGLGREVLDLYFGDTITDIQRELRLFIYALPAADIFWEDIKVITKKSKGQTRPKEFVLSPEEMQGRVAERMEEIFDEIDEVLYYDHGTDWRSLSLDDLLLIIDEHRSEYPESLEIQEAGNYLSLVVYFDLMMIQDKSLLRRYILPLLEKELTEEEAGAILQLLRKRGLYKEAIAKLILEGNERTQQRCREVIEKVMPFACGPWYEYEMKNKIDEILSQDPDIVLPERRNDD